MDDVINNF